MLDIPWQAWFVVIMIALFATSIRNPLPKDTKPKLSDAQEIKPEEQVSPLEATEHETSDDNGSATPKETPSSKLDMSVHGEPKVSPRNSFPGPGPTATVALSGPSKIATRSQNKKKKKKKGKRANRGGMPQRGNLGSGKGMFSSLTASEHKVYLLLKKTFHALPRTNLTPDLREQLDKFHLLEKKVIAGRKQFLRWQELNPFTLTLHPSISKYVKAVLEYQRKRVDNYPRYYIAKDQIAVIGQGPEPKGGPIFQYLGSPLLMGKVPCMMLPRPKSAYKFIPNDGDRLRYPAEPSEESLKDCVWCKTVVSGDSNAEKLALKHGANLVTSSGSLVTVFATHAMCLDRAWEIPVVVKEHCPADGVSRKIVYLDKPLTMPSQTVRERNLLFCKRALKTSVLQPSHQKSIVFSSPVNAGSELVPLDVVSITALGNCFGKLNVMKKTAHHVNEIALHTKNISAELSAGSIVDSKDSLFETYTTEVINPGKTIEAIQDAHVEEQPMKFTDGSGEINKGTLSVPNENACEDKDNCSELSDDSFADGLIIVTASDASAGSVSPGHCSSDSSRAHQRSRKQQTITEVRVARSRTKSAEGNETTTNLLVLPDTNGTFMGTLEDGVADCISPVRRSQRLSQKHEWSERNSVSPSNPKVAKLSDDTICVGLQSDVTGVDHGAEASMTSITGDERAIQSTSQLNEGQGGAIKNARETQNYDGVHSDCNVCYHLWQLGASKMLVRGSVDGISVPGSANKGEYHFFNLYPKMEFTASHGGEELTFLEGATQWLSTALLPKGRLARVRICAQTSRIVGVQNLALSNVVPSYIPFRPTECLRVLASITDKVARLAVGNYLLSHSAGGGAVKILKEIDASTRLKHENVYDLHTQHAIMDPYEMIDCESVPSSPIDPDVTLFGREDIIPGVMLPRKHPLLRNQKNSSSAVKWF